MLECKWKLGKINMFARGMEAKERASDLSDPHAPILDKSFDYSGKHKTGKYLPEVDPDH